MLVQRRLVPAVKADLAHSAPSPADITEVDLPFESVLKRNRLEIGTIEGNALVIRFKDEKILDEQNIQIIGEELSLIMNNLVTIPLSEDGGNKTSDKPLPQMVLILDFKNVKYLSAAALGKLIILNNKAEKYGHRLILCNIDPIIYDTFEITGLDGVLNIKLTLEDAIKVANGLITQK